MQSLRLPLHRTLVPSPVIRDAVVASALVAGLFLMAALDVGGQAALWENAHWTVSVLGASWISIRTWRRDASDARTARALVVGSFALYALGMIGWDIQVALGLFPVPSPTDALFLGSAVPVVAATIWLTRSTLARGELTALLLDALTVALVVASAILLVFGPAADRTSETIGAVLLAYPVVYLGTGVLVFLAALAVRAPIQGLGGPYLVAGALALNGISWVAYIQESITAVPAAGSILNLTSSVALLTMALGWDGWAANQHGSESRRAWAGRLRSSLPVAAVGVAVVFLVMAHPAEPGAEALYGAVPWAVIVVATVRQAMLLQDRTRYLERERQAADRERALRGEAERALRAESVSQERYRNIVTVFGRLGDRLTFAADERHQLTAAAAAIDELLGDSQGQIALINPSRDRMEVAISWGVDGPTDVVAHAVPLDCYGVRKGAPFAIDDVGAAFAVPCAAYPDGTGATVCLPLIANGEAIGTAHLATAGPIGDDDRLQLVRIAEQVAISVTNARLMQATRELALTDPLTGLHNSRFIDAFIDRELVHAERTGGSLGLVMIDLDHFKTFNDAHGHPAGDVALRSFANAVTRAIRREDTLARYGGEEFVLIIRDADAAGAALVAEAARRAVEAMTVTLGPGHYARITASFGVATTGGRQFDRMALLQEADKALYRAKAEGRNRVTLSEHAATSGSDAGRTQDQDPLAVIAPIEGAR